MLLAFGFASPAFADNGPHTSTTNVMNVDRCAGCHRAHTASASYLLTQSESALCQTCHGAAAGGSKLDVFDGVAYGSTGGTGPTGPTGQARIAGDQAGALRGGGFTTALLSSGTGVVSRALSSDLHGLVPALGATSGGVATTSTHNTNATGMAWGGAGYIGATGATGAGTSVTLQCGACHDPHGGANAGFGTFRILKVNPNAGVMVGQVQTVTGSAGSAAVTITPVASTGLAANQLFTLSGVAPAAYNTTYQVVGTPTTTIAANAVTVGRDGTIATKPFVAAPGSYVSGGAILTSAGIVATVSGATVQVTDPVTVVYTFTAASNLAVGQVVSITGMNGSTTNGGLNISGKITAVAGTGTTSITVQGNPGAAAPSGSFTSGGWVTLSNTAVSDSSTYAYTTTNYWAQDDLTNITEAARDANGAPILSASATQTVTSLENNVSRWCTTCHTRLLAGSGSYKAALTAGGTTDAMYAFRHRSDANTNGAAANKAMGDSPNCLTCHVSHGSNASMSGQYSGAVKNPDGTSSAPDSFLLRVDNRGTCQMCHNK